VSKKEKKAWEQPVVFRPSEEDKAMLDWLSRSLYLKPSQVLRQGLKKMYDGEKRTTKGKKGI
jgi:hypothetical protein